MNQEDNDRQYEIESLRAINAELLAALKWIVQRASTSFGGPIVPGDIERVARDAIAKAKEEA